MALHAGSFGSSIAKKQFSYFVGQLEKPKTGFFYKIFQFSKNYKTAVDAKYSENFCLVKFNDVKLEIFRCTKYLVKIKNIICYKIIKSPETIREKIELPAMIIFEKIFFRKMMHECN